MVDPDFAWEKTFRVFYFNDDTNFVPKRRLARWYVLPNTYRYKMKPNMDISFCQVLGLFWPIHRQLYSYIARCSEIMVPKPEPHYPYLAAGHCYLIVIIFLMHTSIRWYQGIYLSAKYWACSGQLRPRPGNKDYRFFLIHNPKGWIQLHMFSNPISAVSFRPLHTKCYSCKYESNEMTEPTKNSSSPTQTQTMLQNSYALPHKYS